MAPAPSPPYAVVDIDGVLADVRHRVHHLRRRPKDWPGFFAAAPQDPVLPEGLAVARRLAENHQLVYLTGRPASCRPDTQAWLARHRLPAGTLRMRPAGDRRPARVTKIEQLRALTREREVALLVDDDEEVVAAARAAGFAAMVAAWMGTDDQRGAEHGAVLRQAQEDDGGT